VLLEDHQPTIVPALTFAPEEQEGAYEYRGIVNDKKYEWMFAGVVLLQAGCWILIPYFTLPNPPIDVLEGFVWSQNIEIGYHKGPPLFAWLLGIGDTVMPASLLPPLVFSQISIGITYWAVWRLAKRTLGPRDALAVLGLTTTIYYFGFPSPEFNPIILQMAFSAITCSFYYTALIEERQSDWIMVGIAVGLGILSRYSIALYLLPMAVFTLMHQETRWRWLTPGFLAGAIIATVIAAPHIWWVINNDLNTLHYIDQRAGTADGLDRLVRPLRFAGAQLAAVAPALIVLLLAIFPLHRNSSMHAQAKKLSPLSRNYMLAIGIAPALFVIVMAMILGRAPRAMWGAGLWIFTPLLGIVLLREFSFALYRRRLMAIWTIVFLLPVVAFALGLTIWPSLSGRNKRVHFPGPALAEIVTDNWHRITGQPLAYIVGEMWLAGSAGYFSADRPRVFQNGSLRDTPWIDLSHLKRCGAVVLYHALVDRDYYVKMFADLGMRYEEQNLMVLPIPRFAVPSASFTVGWAIAWPSTEPPSSTSAPCGPLPRMTDLSAMWK
jgi:4-amino-4-deoxy-L-arabinose transferase-like glycosyltransferase